ncbi:LuxR family transcriptional regulator [Anabaena minutissima FACHB-250]|nr:LuxR family transcriptional regulator [Anabaena minutissima FACHB-250]
MKFAPLIEKITMVSNEVHLRSCFMDYAGKLVGATAWGLDLLDSRLRVLESDLWGVRDTFRDRYQEVGQSEDRVSQRMIQQQIPVHHLSVQSLKAWHQSALYQDVFRNYGLEHGMVAPLIGVSRLIGGIYFLRGKEFPTFNDSDLIHVGSLCQHLSVRLATLRFAISPSLINCLTPREVDVAELVAQGLSNREIALKLYISRDAVKQVLKRMFQKLDVSARAEMVARLKA